MQTGEQTELARITFPNTFCSNLDSRANSCQIIISAILNRNEELDTVSFIVSLYHSLYHCIIHCITVSIIVSLYHSLYHCINHCITVSFIVSLYHSLYHCINHYCSNNGIIMCRFSPGGPLIMGSPSMKPSGLKSPGPPVKNIYTFKS